MAGGVDISENILHVEDEGGSCARKNSPKGKKLNPIDQHLQTPSPTGYRDYKPPAEVLGYSTFHKTKTVDSPNRTAQKSKLKEQEFTHKVSFPFFSFWRCNFRMYHAFLIILYLI